METTDYMIGGSGFASQNRAPHTLEIRQLRYALLAADFRSFAKAAAFAGIKNATLSRHISYLEQIFEAALFNRSTRGVVPTEVGEVFLDAARRVLERIEGLYETTRAVSTGSAGSIGIGFITSITAGNLKSSLFAFQDEFPHIMVRGVEEDRRKLLMKLEAGSLDLLIIGGSAAYADTISLELWSERMFAALPKHHPLAKNDKVYWSDLIGETFLAPMTTADDIQTMVNARLGHQGNDPVVVTEVSRETVLGAVSGGRAITIISAGSAGTKIDDVTLRPLFDTSGPHVLNFSAHWRKENRNPALKTFLDFLTRRYSLPAPGA